MQLVNAQVLERGNALTDELVVSQVVAGQTAMFEVLMRRYNERIYRAVRAILREEAEVEDVMQQAYLNAYAHLRQFDGRALFSTWLTRIAVNEALARVRRRRPYEPFDEETHNVDRDAFDGAAGHGGRVMSDPTNNPERAAVSKELRELLEGAIDELPDGAREVFVLREVEGLSTAEAAAALDVSEDVVKTRLSRARSALRRLLIERTGAAAPEVFRYYRPRCDRLVCRVLEVITT